MRTARTPELIELSALRAEMTAAIETARTCAAQGLRLIQSRIGSTDPRDVAEVRTWLRSLAHGFRLGLSEGPPVAVVGPCSMGGHALVVVCDGSVVVRRLSDQQVIDLHAVAATVGEARWWCASVEGLEHEASAIGVEDLPALIVGLMGREK